MQYQTNYPYATASQQYGALSHARDEQRRRQQEYSLALAQQVAQREQQRRHEREMDQPHRRHSGAFPNPPNQNFRQEAFKPAERGILDGLGHNNPQNTRKSFARGQPQLHHRLPGGPESFDYSPANNFPPTHNVPPVQHQPSVSNQAFQSGFGFPGTGNVQQQHPMPQQSWQQQQPIPVTGAVGPPPFAKSNVHTGWGVQNPQQNSMASSQYWAGQGIPEQAAPPPPAVYAGYSSPQRPSFQPGHPQDDPPNAHNAGRRQRTDIHDGGHGDLEEAERIHRKQQQQHEMQQALERQIEEKRQQKLEAKRRQEEEDRREMERFEEDQRRQRAEQERLQEEKCRKAELEQQKADQAAAAVAAANQQAKRQHQQKLHAQHHQPQLQHPQPCQQQNFQPPQLQQLERFPNVPLSDRSKNPFANSRAHLFEDPPQRDPMPPNNHFGYSNQNASPIRGATQGYGQTFQQENNVVGQSVDPTELRRQYDDMREELRRQKQLVDQLRQAQAHIQQQQQQRSPMRVESGNIPTLLDLEKLRNELRGELAYREQLHRQELESIKREQRHERSPTHSPRRYLGTKNSLELPVRILSKVECPEASKKRDLPIKRQQALRDKAPLNESLMSLRGESRFVYFDAEARGHPDEENSTDKQDGAPLDEQSESIKVEASLPRRSIQKRVQFSSTRQSIFKQSVVGTRSVSPSREDADTDSDDDAHDFVVAGIRSSPSHEQLTSSRSLRTAASSHRYSQLPPALSSSSSPSRVSSKWRLESMGTTDSDDDLDESLDGDQLEALFQRNVRRHEILLGFQSKFQRQPRDSKQQQDSEAPHAKLAWAELHQQLENNRRLSTLTQRRKLSTTSTTSNDSDQEQAIDEEAALVASSKWTPSTVQGTTSM
ncbi:hypothetical protein PC129_g4988 [Phytophthora cactorum]|uniref:Uncharacterized protein n=2 Tax=Phytophthora cactorum TaxID=29920 RepID=A0A329SKQ8_9STRA|nr:hypothetical protein Pcac1_g19780 [Phytophthora cactorum]KAG2838995.1 hypothetical protein PC112_g4297 [Phytophthora cactorum]KAG2840817.1 hypothetical protein PC111_g3324 [Phytophthora cactorum]KAG2864840.1 hypothetical protein PC113_g4233 [Phytophthora cactorum]KAG2921836.1 hypothetical protein PC114_g5529 [Phytophthora cactorum]